MVAELMREGEDFKKSEYISPFLENSGAAEGENIPQHWIQRYKAREKTSLTLNYFLFS